MKHRLVW